MAINQFPIILIVRKFRGMCEIADIIHGNINRDELYIHLMMNADAFNEQMKIDIREENERAARESLLQEQQQAYQESLLADRAKEEERLRVERAIESERQKQESEQADKAAKKEADRKHAENSLPPEPTSEGAQQITKIRFRKPTGDFVERKFTVDTQLKVSVIVLILASLRCSNNCLFLSCRFY
jgi:RecG-like helicase